MAHGPEQGGGAEQAPAEVVITGGAGQIGYQLAPLIASGQTFGDRSVKLRLLELRGAQQAAEGVAAELQDGAYPNLAGVDIFEDPKAAFDGATHVFMVGAMPRGPGMERSDLLEANGGIFKEQGAALETASDDVKVLVVGNPANSNALVVGAYAPEVAEKGHITAMSRLDHNRALGMAAAKLSISPNLIDKITIWGNHSNSMVVDTAIATVGGSPLEKALQEAEVDMEEFAAHIATRGKHVIDLRGASSALSAARAASDHMHDWEMGTGRKSWTSAAVLTQGGYGLPEGVYASMPVTSRDGELLVVGGEELAYVNSDNGLQAKIQATGEELLGEKAALQDLGFLPK